MLQIGSLLDAGLTTEIIRAVLPCTAQATSSRYPAPDFVERSRLERDRMAERLEHLTRDVQALDDCPEAVARS